MLSGSDWSGDRRSSAVGKLTPSLSGGGPGRGWGTVKYDFKQNRERRTHPHPDLPLEGEGVQFTVSIVVRKGSRDLLTTQAAAPAIWR